jgi:hypothetical protein
MVIANHHLYFVVGLYELLIVKLKALPHLPRDLPAFRSDWVGLLAEGDEGNIRNRVGTDGGGGVGRIVVFEELIVEGELDVGCSIVETLYYL